MNILGIETSCDETAVSLIQTKEEEGKMAFTVLSNELISQAKIHEQYGGVFPVVAKREHGKNLIPLLLKTLQKSNLLSPAPNQISSSKLQDIQVVLEREAELKEQFLKTLSDIQKPPIDVIAVTEGPGLEPALWVGISFAKALNALWDIPVVAVNHMEGHIFSALIEKNHEQSSTETFQMITPKLPALSLLISGGHTELVLIKNPSEYKIVGKTRDDAVGEAFDKVARILGLPYPGGPEISRLAEIRRQKTPSDESNDIKLPRPMIRSNDLDFSFSGLKTAVLYMAKEISDLTQEIKEKIAKEFEDAVTEVLISKVAAAIEEYGIKTLIIGGGVIANTHIRKSFSLLGENKGVTLHIPSLELTGDNALMIAIVGAIKAKEKTIDLASMKAKGNLMLN